MSIKPLFCLTAWCVFGTAVVAEEPAVSEAIRGLTSKDDDTKSKSIAYLKNHYAEAKQAMLAALDSEPEDVAWAVTASFMRMGKKAIPDLIAAFQGAGSLKKIKLVYALRDFSEAAAPAVPTLHAQLDSTDDDVRVVILSVLGNIGDLRSVPVLTRHLRDKNWRVRDRVIGSLLRFEADAQPAMANLIACVKDKPPDGVDETTQEFYWGFIAAAEICLGQIGRPAVPLLAAEIVNRDNPAQVRRYFIRAVYEMANRDYARQGDATLAIPTLGKVINDPDLDVRIATLSALGIICSKYRNRIDPDKSLDWLFEPEAIKKMSELERFKLVGCAAPFKKYRGLASALIDEGLRSKDVRTVRTALSFSLHLDDDIGSVAPALVRLMQHSDEGVRRLSIERVKGDNRFIIALPALAHIIKNDKSAECRRVATKKAGLIMMAFFRQMPG